MLPLLSAAALFVLSASAKPDVAAAWFGGWHADDFPPSAVSWDKYTHVTYSFAETTPDVRNLSLLGSDPDVLPEFVSLAHQNGVKAVVSIGGWTGSLFYSTNVGSAENRTAFVDTVLNLTAQYDLDGLDFDWESPVTQGIGCNAINPDDTTNFLSFLQELRARPEGASLLLTAAAGIGPWVDASGSPGDMSGFGGVLDYVAIMNYDIWGPWSDTAGPNAPLADACAPPAAQVGSATSAVAAWTAAGVPAEQLLLGVAAYGHSFRVAPSDALANGTQTLELYPAFDANDTPVGDKWDDAPGVDECGNAQAQGGLFDYWGLIQSGFLQSNGTPSVGIAYVYDTCTQTPYVYNATSEVLVSFDNAQSFTAKGAFIQSQNLAGFAMWEAGGDFQDELLDSIRQAAGL